MSIIYISNLINLWINKNDLIKNNLINDLLNHFSVIDNITSINKYDNVYLININLKKKINDDCFSIIVKFIINKINKKLNIYYTYSNKLTYTYINNYLNIL